MAVSSQALSNQSVSAEIEVDQTANGDLIMLFACLNLLDNYVRRSTELFAFCLSSLHGAVWFVCRVFSGIWSKAGQPKVWIWIKPRSPFLGLGHAVPGIVSPTFSDDLGDLVGDTIRNFGPLLVDCHRLDDLQTAQ